MTINVPETLTYGASNKYDSDNPGGFAHTALSVAVASVADFGTSVYNSVNLGNWMGDDADTYDFLNGLGMDNVADKYLENEDLVQGISFIGGAFVPGGLAIKASRAARSGLSATNYFNPKALSTSIEKSKEMVREGRAATQAYKAQRRSAVTQGMGQGALDNVAVELAIVGSMNEHAWMEDYMDDIPKSMALSLGLGSAVGGLVDFASTAYRVRGATQRAMAEVNQPVIDATGTKFAAADPVTRAHELKAGIDRVDQIMQTEGMAPATIEFAARRKKTMEGEIGNTVRKIFDDLGETVEDADASAMMTQLEDLITDPKFLGVSEVKFFKADELAAAPQQPSFMTRAKQFVSEPARKLQQAATKSEAPPPAYQARAVYSPRLDTFVSPEEAPSLSGAVDITTLKELKRGAKQENWVQPRDRELDFLSANAGTMEEGIFKSITSLDPDNYRGWGVNPPNMHRTDLGGLQGSAAAYRKLRAQRDALVEKKVKSQQDGLVRDKQVESINKKLDNFKISVTKKGVTDSRKMQSPSNRETIAGPDIERFAQQRTDDMIRTLAREMGTAPEIIALKTNTQVDHVLRTLGGADAADPNFALRAPNEELTDVYRALDSEMVAKEFAPTNKLLSLTDNGKLDSYNDYLVMLEGRNNQEMLDQWNKQFVLEGLLGSHSEGHKLLLKHFGLDNLHTQKDFDATVQLLKDDLGLVNDEISKGRLFQSADMQSRHMGDAGIIINKMGDSFVRVGNKVNEKYQKMANGPLRGLANDPTQLTGINTIVQALRLQSGGKIVYKDRKLLRETGVDKEGKTKYAPVEWDGKPLVVPENWKDVDALIKVWEMRGAELQNMKATEAKILGKVGPGDTGLWIPPIDTRNRIVHFARVQGDDGEFRNQVVTGRTEAEVAEKTRLLRERHGESISIISPSERNAMEQRQYDKLKAQLFDGTMENADSSLRKRGYSSEELFDTGLDTMRDIEHGFAAQTFAQLQKAQSLIFDDVLSALDLIQKNAEQAIAGSNLGKTRKFLEKGVSNAQIMKSQLMGSNDLLSHYTTWQNLNTGFESAVETGIHHFSKITGSTLMTTVPGKKAKQIKATEVKWEEVNKAMDQAGFPYPFKGLSAMNVEQGFAHSAADPNARRVVAAANNFASTMALRFGETAHSLVNMMSQPIMTSSAIRGGNRNSFMGKQLAEGTGGLFEATKTMYQGVAAMNSDQYATIMKKAEANGLLDPIVSEASAVIRAANLNEKGALASAERGIEKLERFMPVGKNKRGAFVAFSDGAEVLSRRAAFATGIVDGIKKYGFKQGVDDTAMYIYAKDFMDRAIGNYMPHQRPVAFQGSLGAAVGLFQTYMVTFAQNMYRHLEVRDFSGMGQAMLWQGSVFGIPSMPGMTELSPIIGEHFSKDNVDIKTGLMGMTDDTGMQDLLAYGLPSSLGSLIGMEGGGPNVAGRGTVTPRFGIPPGLDMVLGAAKSVKDVVGSMHAAGFEAGAAALGEAISTQSVSRPLARTMELVTGYSVNQAGRTVATPEEVWQSGSILARLIGTRPTGEVRMREAAHLNTFYGSLDREKRQKSVNNLRQHIRYGSLDNGAIERAAEGYFDNNGSPQGFRSALNTALQNDSRNLGSQLRGELDRDSPMLNMLNDM